MFARIMKEASQELMEKIKEDARALFEEKLTGKNMDLKCHEMMIVIAQKA